MANFLRAKRVVLGVTGSIAAYKSADLIRRLREAGAQVRVVMTENAKRFITPLTLQAVSGYPVHDDLFDLQAEAAMGHIDLAKWAEVILVAPASADFMARLHEGRANDLLTAVCLATSAPIALAPAMNQAMWHHTLTQQNYQALLQKKIRFFGPEQGSQACGDYGFGRLLEPTEIVKALADVFSNGLLAGKQVLVTAGPTHEYIDPIRYIANHSSGKMGYALAEAALAAGANVTLISGPVAISASPHIEVIKVTSAFDMQQAVLDRASHADLFFAVAAVSDYRVPLPAKQKLAKTNVSLTLNLERNPDIVTAVGLLNPKPFIVGFAAETEHVLTHAKEKLLRKKMDMIIANQVNKGIGMGVDENQVTVLYQDQQVALPLLPKTQLARELIPLIANQYFQHQSGRQHE